jgi:hypothetical protein
VVVRKILTMIRGTLMMVRGIFKRAREVSTTLLPGKGMLGKLLWESGYFYEIITGENHFDRVLVEVNEIYMMTREILTGAN